MDDVAEQPPSSESSSGRTDPKQLQEETAENNEEIAQINSQSSIEASINSLVDNNTVVEPTTHLQETEFSEATMSTIGSDGQSTEQNISGLTPKDTIDVPEQSHQEAIPMDSEPGALEDILDRQQDGASTVTASSDVDTLLRLSTSSSESKQLQIDDAKEPITDTTTANVTDVPIENSASTLDAGDHVTENAVPAQDILINRQQDGGSAVGAASDVDNLMRLSISSSESKQLQIDDAKEPITDTTTANVTDVPIENSASTLDAGDHVTENAIPAQDILINRQQDGGSAVGAASNVDNLMRLSISSSESKQLQIDDAKEPITDSSTAKVTDVPIENSASTPDAGVHVTENAVPVEDIFINRQQDDGSTVGACSGVDNFVRLSTSSESKELQIDDAKEPITDSPGAINVTDVTTENSASTPDAGVHVTENAVPVEDIFINRQQDDGSIVGACSGVDNLIRLSTSTSESKELQIDDAKEAITDLPVTTNVTDVPIENSASTPDAGVHVTENTVPVEDIFINRQQDDGSTIGACSGVDNLIRLSTSTSESKELQIDDAKEAITDLPVTTNVTDVPIENSASTPDAGVHVTESTVPVEDIFINRQQDDGSTIGACSGVDNLIRLSTSSSESKELQIDDAKEPITDSPGTTNVADVTIENSASTPDAGVHVTENTVPVEDIFINRQQDGGSTVGDFDNQIEPLASSSEKSEFHNDNKEQKIDICQTKTNDVAAKAFPSLTTAKIVAAKRGIIDTAAPFESVKEAVSKFGGIVDWKAHRTLTVERRKQVEQELEKAHEEIPEYRKRSEAAEKAKVRVLQELDSTKRLIEELKLNLERAQTEECQARQDSELAKLRVEEMEQGITEDSSVAAKAQLEVAKARYTTAITELTTVKQELEDLRSEYTSLVTEKFEALKRAEEAVAASKQVERTVEDLTIELIATKESLETAHAAHMEAEDHRIGTVMARDQDFLNWEKELKQAEAELESLNQKILCANDVKSKLRKASTLLVDLKAELSAYMESKSNQEGDEEVMSKGDREQQEKKTNNEIQEAVASAKKELEEVKLNIEKAFAEVNYLKVSATSLRSELEQEKSSLASLRQREGMASITVASLEAELDKTRSETVFVQMKEKEGREQILVLPKKLQLAAEEANQANLLAEAARDELRRVKEEVEQAKARESTMRSRLLAAQKEIAASKASERLAIEAIKALQESESARSRSKTEVDSSKSVTLSVEEYYHLSKQAHAAEEEANMRVASANLEIDIANKSELKTLKKLNEVNKEMAARRESLKIAMDKAERAREGKLGVEQELRKWRAEHQQQRKAGGVASENISQSVSFDRSKEGSNFDHSHSATIPVHYFSNQKSSIHSHNESGSSPDAKNGKKKKKSFLPRLFMFFGRRKAHH